MATKTAIRARLKSAKSAAEKLEEDVRWLVKERAWKTLGYENFSAMWKGENGLDTPMSVKIIAISELVSEGLNSRTGTAALKYGPDGHRIYEIAELVGMSVRIDSNGYKQAQTTASVISQILSGTPFNEISSSNGYQARSRMHPKRQGKSLGEMIKVGWSVYKYQADAVKEIARKADVPDSVVVRSALDLYLNRKQSEAS